MWYYYPSSPHQLKKNNLKVGPPLTKFSGSPMGAFNALIRQVIFFNFWISETEDQSRLRFQSELEFVQCLANPNYLNCKYMFCTFLGHVCLHIWYVNKNSFCYFRIFSPKTYVVGTQKNRLNETVLLSTENTCVNCPYTSMK